MVIDLSNGFPISVFIDWTSRELSDPVLFSVALICRFDLHKTKKSQKSRNNLMFRLTFTFKSD